MNNLIKRIDFGMVNFTHLRIRALLIAGKPDWSLLATLTPVTIQALNSLGL